MFVLMEAARLAYSFPAVVSLVTAAALLVPLLILLSPSPADISDELRRTHRRLGGSGQHLGGPRAQRPDLLALPQAGRTARIHSLHVYPVKSCRGIQLSHSAVMPKGLESMPLLANVQVDLWLPDDKTKGGGIGGRRGQGSRTTPGGLVVITFPLGRAGADAGFARGLVQMAAARLGRGLGAGAVPPRRQIVLPLDFPSPVEIERKRYRYEDVQFFRKRFEALNLAGEVPPELAAYLGVKAPMSLFRMDPSRRRDVYGNAPRKEVVGFQPVVDFQDQYPLHLLSLSSVRALESKIHKDDNLRSLDPQRFRPNIVVSGLPEYDEDDWRIIQVKPATPRGLQDSLNFDVSCRTVRCTLPNVDPATGIRHKLEPDHSLRKHREIDGGAPKRGCLGMQLCPFLGDTEKGVLKVGMEIHVVQRGPHFAL
ncbi:Mitochondrial amidoxime reducing component 2 [Escovopsis weberi]|uniref:Mitochondrial amidoxime reducing component 2 n=1 Tax=Escovopsis weberi TaxID=150374 RepID=A0A0M9VT04_ESCWE|nr:Mitochondrial amidoxime reducing component 2 [Escovopsis weberi]